MPTPHLTIGTYMRDRQLPLALVRDDRYRSCPLHTHEFSELVVVLGGRGAHRTEAGDYDIEAGDAFVIKSGRVHGYRVPKTLELVNILYDEAALRVPMKDLPALPGYHALFTLEPVYRAEHGLGKRLRLRSAQIRQVRTLVDAMEQEIHSREPGYVFMATAVFMQIVCYLSRCYAEARSRGSHPLFGMGQVMSFIETNYKTNLTLSELAQIANMSESSLLRTFRKATGTSPIDYVIRLRVHKACELLMAGGGSVTEIAYEVGFVDSNYFSRQFKKVTAYRKQAWRRFSAVTI
jgi:AraC-like DNA-binding protein